MSAEHPMPGDPAVQSLALIAKWCHLAATSSGHAQMSQTLSSGQASPRAPCKHIWDGQVPRRLMVTPSLHGSARRKFQLKHRYELPTSGS